MKIPCGSTKHLVSILLYNSHKDFYFCSWFSPEIAGLEKGINVFPLSLIQLHLEFSVIKQTPAFIKHSCRHR